MGGPYYNRVPLKLVYKGYYKGYYKDLMWAIIRI